MFLTPEEIQQKKKRKLLLMKLSIPIIAIAVGALIALLGSSL
ncbi:hypothetical protein [Bacillus taeanensis]|nr:hypothetical protein [Bacillus taeanensis]